MVTRQDRAVAEPSIAAGGAGATAGAAAVSQHPPEAEAQLRFQAQLLDAVGQAVIALDLDHRITYWNRAAEALYGWTAAEAVGHSAARLVPTSASQTQVAAIWDALRRGESWSGEFVVQRRDGTTFPALVTNSPVRDATGHLVGFVGTSSDLTERREAVEHLRRLNTRLRLLLDTASSLATTLDPKALLDGLLERVIALLPHADTGAVFLYDPASGYLVPQASVGWDQAAIAQIRLRPGESSSGIAFQTGQSLRVPESIGVDAIFESFSPATRHLISPDSLPGRLRSSLTVPLRVADGSVIGTLAVWSSTIRFARDDLQLLEGVASQAALALQNARLYAQAQHDAQELQTALAELKAAEAQLVQQERLRALGEMASGIAHDFNNALVPVLGFSELLLVDPDVLDNRCKTRSYLEAIHGGANDAAGVVRRLREFYREHDAPEALLPVDLADVVTTVVELTRPRWKDQPQANGRTIVVATDFEPLPPVAGIETHLREALTNVIFNAVDALPHGGTITLRLHPDAAEPRLAVLAVADTGTGMTEDVRRRCLDPFFTTKGAQGTGLGLSMVHGIVSRHGGRLELHSAPGQGTTVTIRLPLFGEPVPAPTPATATTDPGAATALRVLVVDDEPGVCEVVAALLRQDGHTVETAPDGQQALDRLQDTGFDAIVTDRAMPGICGEQLAAAAKEIRSAIPVILLTGFGDLMLAANERPAGVDAVVAKPVTGGTLRHALEDVSRRYCMPAARGHTARHPE
jgi:PAS domain S-box-containing protein